MSATMDCAEVLVVFEGAGRLHWRRVGAAEWVPTGLWPDLSQADELAERRSRREPVLVLIECTPTVVEVMSEEFADAPPCVAALAADPGADVVSLEIPFLDWLPAELRRRGARFARAVADQIARTPRGLLPNVVLEPTDAEEPSIRFGCRLSARTTPAELKMIAQHAFQGPNCPSRLEIERHARAC